MRRLFFLLLASGLACSGPVDHTTPAHVAPWLRADRQRCLIARDLGEGMEDMARRCAERFVQENGYTDVPADDSTRWVREQDDAAAWPTLLALRSGTLEAQATAVQCSQRQCIVLFRVRRPMLFCAYRAVTMTQVFTKIQLAPGGIRDVRCEERRV
jgi:hypothetical protein